VLSLTTGFCVPTLVLGFKKVFNIRNNRRHFSEETRNCNDGRSAKILPRNDS
jgi:hypothetical protein